MSNPKLDFEQRSRAQNIIEAVEVHEVLDMEQLAFRIVFSEDEVERLRGLLEEVLNYADQQIRDFETYTLVDDNTLARIRQALHREEGES